jgi:hypothetical protein
MVMRYLCRRDLRDDRGSIIIAIMGIMILATVAMVGLAAVVNGQNGTRHDNRFAQALRNAESGVDAMVATLKSSDRYNSPTQALANSPATLSRANTYSVTAKAINTLGETGNASITRWTIVSVGTAVVAGKTLTRQVTQTVSISHDYTTPLLGTNQLSLPAGSSVSTYTMGDGDSTCGETVNGVAETACTSQMIPGITLPLGLGTLGSTTITNIPVGGAPGPAQTGGALDVQSSDLSGFSQIQLDGPSAACSSTNTAPCSTSTIVVDDDPPPAIATPGCTSGVGATVNGIGITGIPAFGLVLNTNIVAQLYPPNVKQEICTNLPVVIPTIGTNLNALGLSGLTGLTGLAATLDVPLGANCLTSNGSLLSTLSTTLLTGNLTCTMNNPSNLVINSLGSVVYIGTGTSVPTYLSALIAAPNGNCIINGNVVLYGTMNCQTITYTAGSSLTMYYPTDANLGFNDTKHKDTVANWNECNNNYRLCS